MIYTRWTKITLDWKQSCCMRQNTCQFVIYFPCQSVWMFLYRLCCHDKCLGLASRHLRLTHFPFYPWIHRFLPYSVCDSCFCALCRSTCKKVVPFAAVFRKIWAFYCGQIELLYSCSTARESKIIGYKESHIDLAPVLVSGEKEVINDNPEWKTNKPISELLFASTRIKTNLRWWTFGCMTQFNDVDAKLVLKRTLNPNPNEKQLWHEILPLIPLRLIHPADTYTYSRFEQ